jgi:hypothetical protein
MASTAATLRPPRQRTAANKRRMAFHKGEGLPGISARIRFCSQNLVLIGENASSWLSNARFGRFANVLKTSYGRQTRVFARSDPTYAITDACVLAERLGTGPCGRTAAANERACF